MVKGQNNPSHTNPMNVAATSLSAAATATATSASSSSQQTATLSYLDRPLGRTGRYVLRIFSRSPWRGT
jgi:hypothetical protein